MESLRNATAFSKFYEKEDQAARELETSYKKGSTTLTESQEMAQGIATAALCQDMVYQLRNGKTIKFTERAKKLIVAQEGLLETAGILENENGKYKCLICGDDISKGSIAMVETDGSSNAMCFKCLNSKNTFKLDADLKLIKICD